MMVIVCGVRMKTTLQARAAEHLVPGGWCLWGMFWNLWKLQPCWRKHMAEIGFEVDSLACFPQTPLCLWL